MMPVYKNNISKTDYYLTAIFGFLILSFQSIADAGDSIKDSATALALQSSAEGGVRIQIHPATGVARFVSVRDRQGDLLPSKASMQIEEKTNAFLIQYGDLFGIKNPQQELLQVKKQHDAYGFTSLSFVQIYQGVPVFGSFLRSHINQAGRLTVLNGTTIPNIHINSTPSISSGEAEQIALGDISRQISQKKINTTKVAGNNELGVVSSKLFVYRGNLTKPGVGINRLVYVVEVSNSVDVREFVFIDAHIGEIVNQITGIHDNLDRRVYDGNFGADFLIWAESDPLPFGNTSVDNQIDYAEDTYNLFAGMTNGMFLSWNGVSGTMHSIHNSVEVPCPNAFWNGVYTAFCSGVTADDTVGHEWAHAYTDSTHDLIYQYQSGALNEAYSDIWGEVVDLLNSDGLDAPNGLRTQGGCSLFGAGSPAADNSYRWLAGEDNDAFNGAIRDMWRPNCYGDPGKVSDAEYWCRPGDGGGVHTNSGIPNHAFALIVDGGSFNSQSITGIGLTKAAHIYWRAQSTYQGPSSGFFDHADALQQSCGDLIGVDLYALNTDSPGSVLSGEIISAEDCMQVSNAIEAVELRTEPSQCHFPTVLDPYPPALCGGGPLTTSLLTDWESGLSAWTPGSRNVANPPVFLTGDWSVVTELPNGRTGSAVFVEDLNSADCSVAQDQSGVIYLESPDIVFPTGQFNPHLAFDHWVATESGVDGGNLKISVNGGPWSLIPSSAFIFNPYPQTLLSSGQGNSNPMAGEPAFTGTNFVSGSGSWGQSQIDLTGIVSPGDTVRIRLEMGINECHGVVGWYVDNVQAYSCEIVPEPPKVCTTFTSNDVPKSLPVGVPSVSSNLDIVGSSKIVDLNVLGLTGTHTWIADLDFRLTSPDGTSVQIMAPSCGNSDNFNLNLDDDAPPGPWPCPPVGGGTYRPSTPLRLFDGQNANGTWRLTLNDSFVGADGGGLNNWALEVCVAALDSDEDGIADAQDNCTLVPNPNQSDTDNDLIGNGCDPDFNNDWIVNATDLAYLKQMFFTSDPLADLDGDGFVNAADLAVLQTLFFSQPGPSGLRNIPPIGHPTSNCAVSGCHDGSSGPRGKPPAHPATTNFCGICHGSTNWLPPLSPFDHSQILQSNCESAGCHSSAEKPPAHPETSLSCEFCHKPTSWRDVIPLSHDQLTNCYSSGCHDGTGGVTAIPPSHLMTTNICEACHTYPNWNNLNTPFPHSQAYITTCSVCHNGQIATGLPVGHCDTQSVDCVQCHNSVATWFDVSNFCSVPSPTPGPIPGPTPGPTPVPSPTPGPTPSPVPVPGPVPTPTPTPTPTPVPPPPLTSDGMRGGGG